MPIRHPSPAAIFGTLPQHLQHTLEGYGYCHERLYVIGAEYIRNTRQAGIQFGRVSNGGAFGRGVFYIEVGGYLVRYLGKHFAPVHIGLTTAIVNLQIVHTGCMRYGHLTAPVLTFLLMIGVKGRLLCTDPSGQSLPTIGLDAGCQVGNSLYLVPLKGREALGVKTHQAIVLVDDRLVLQGHVPRVVQQEKHILPDTWEEAGPVLPLALAKDVLLSHHIARIALVADTEALNIPGAEVVRRLTGLGRNERSGQRLCHHG